MEPRNTPDVALKYCGSCNPYYDPAEATDRLVGLLGFRPQHSTGDLPDYCVIFKQCNSDCFADPEQYSRKMTFVIQRLEQIPGVAQALLRELNPDKTKLTQRQEEPLP